VTGVAGDPAKSSAELGQIGVDLIIDQSVTAIRQAVAARASPTKQE
jgi:creatinine amidohydrolase/Fe(II)-dependent formamide hydrolase-like protein